MLKESIRNQYKSEFKQVIKETECKTAEDVVDLLFGTYWNDYQSDYIVKERYPKMPKITFMNRFNKFWVYPIWAISTPFRYLAIGRVYVNEDSKLGKVLIYLIGELN